MLFRVGEFWALRARAAHAQVIFWPLFRPTLGLGGARTHERRPFSGNNFDLPARTDTTMAAGVKTAEAWWLPVA